jgi:hypothetical protein
VRTNLQRSDAEPEGKSVQTVPDGGEADGCQAAEIDRRMTALYGAKCIEDSSDGLAPYVSNGQAANDGHAKTGAEFTDN